MTSRPAGLTALLAFSSLACDDGRPRAYRHRPRADRRHARVDAEGGDDPGRRVVGAERIDSADRHGRGR